PLKGLACRRSCPNRSRDFNRNKVLATVSVILTAFLKRDSEASITRTHREVPSVKTALTVATRWRRAQLCGLAGCRPKQGGRGVSRRGGIGQQILRVLVWCPS